MRLSFSIVLTTVGCVCGTSRDVLACPLCDSERATQVRKIVLSAEAGPPIVATGLTFAATGAVLALVHVSTYRRRRS